jgi:hypothetical protein
MELATNLERFGAPLEARPLWEGIIRDKPDSSVYPQDRLALNYRWERNVQGLLDSASAVDNPVVVEELAADYHSDSCLSAWLAAPRTRSAFRPALTRVLMQRYLDQGRFTEFLAQYRSLAPGERGPFPAAETAARTLAAHPDDPKGLINMGYFLMRRRDYHNWDPRHADPDSLWLMSHGSREPPNLKPPICGEDKPDDAPIPYGYFLRAAGRFTEKDRNEDEAKALYYLLECTSGSYLGDQCGGKADAAQRLAWRDTLKRKYPRSKWNKP